MINPISQLRAARYFVFPRHNSLFAGGRLHIGFVGIARRVGVHAPLGNKRIVFAKLAPRTAWHALEFYKLPVGNVRGDQIEEIANGGRNRKFDAARAVRSGPLIVGPGSACRFRAETYGTVVTGSMAITPPPVVGASK